jgi:hypothetical protein
VRTRASGGIARQEPLSVWTVCQPRSPAIDSGNVVGIDLQDHVAFDFQ